MSDTADLTLAPSVKTNSALPPLPKISGYELIREKGRGPRAVVYKARRIFENDIVAVKLFHPGACDITMQGRLETGIERTEGLHHPGMIKALGFARDEQERAFLVMEYASGEALSSFLFRRQQFPVLKAVGVVLHCARTLHYAASKGFTHGRLHPGAVILSRNNVRIAGIGMGERSEHAEWPAGKDQSPHVFEPLIYAAPELMPSKADAVNKAAADVYSLGAIFFHMLTCTPPFKCSDEGALEAERASLKPRHPVVWPVETFATLSPEATELVEAMLAPAPADRPVYDEIIARCVAIQNLLTKGVDGAVEFGGGKNAEGTPDASGKLRTKSAGKSSSHAVATVGKSTASKDAATPAAGDTAAASASRRVSQRTARAQAPRSFADIFFSMLLFGMTLLVLLAVAYITIQPQLQPEYQFVKSLLVPPATSAPGVAAPEPKAVVPEPVGPPKQIVVVASPEEEKLARRQLDTIEEMLKSNQLTPSEGLAKVLRSIAERAGVASSTGIRAIIRAGDIEAQVANARPTDTIAPELARALTSAAEALKNVTQAPPPPPPAPVAPPVAAKIEPPKVEAPKPVLAGAAEAVKEARTMMRSFGYPKAKEFIAQFAAKGDTEQKRLADDFKLSMNLEEGLFERTRAKLLDQIKKSPKHESPLQVFIPKPGAPKETTAIDIINFDEKGLHLLDRGTPNATEKVTPWERAPASQVLNLFMAPTLTARNNLEDQLGIAAFAFNRGLAVEAEEALGRAQAVPGGKERADALADIFTRVSRAVDGK